jgi:hypothetical protein
MEDNGPADHSAKQKFLGIVRLKRNVRLRGYRELTSKGIPRATNRKKKPRRNGYPRGVWGFYACSRNSWRDWLSFCRQKD